MTTTNALLPSLDILIVVWREVDAVQSLYKILQQQSFQNYRVLVALNDPDDAINEAMPKDPKWHYHTGLNEGYAGGLQRLLSYIKSEWVLCSNTDLTFGSHFLEQFINATTNAADHIGYMGPKILFGDGRLQCAGGLLLGPEGLCQPRGIGEQDNTCLDYLSEVPILSGCCFMIRKQVLDDVGGFDPKFFMYVEDVHLFLKAIWAGWMGKYLPQIEITHDHGGSNERYGPLHLYHLERNHWWVSPQLPISMVLLKPWQVIRRWFSLVFCNKAPLSDQMPKAAGVIAIKALVHGLLGLPRQYMKPFKKKITTSDFNRIFKEHRVSMKELLSK